MNVRIDPGSYSGFSNIKENVYLPFLAIEEGIQGPNQVIIREPCISEEIPEPKPGNNFCYLCYKSPNQVII